MQNYRNAWLALYVMAVVIAASAYAYSGKLFGDFTGVAADSMPMLWLGAASVVACYVIWMIPVFNWMAAIKIRPLRQHWAQSMRREETVVGTFVLVMQCTYLFFSITHDVNVAGSTHRTDSVVKYLWVLFPPDVIFLVYYGMYRKSRWFMPNLAVYIGSNLLRSWVGTLVIVFFIEGAHWAAEGMLRRAWKNLLLVAVFLVAALPVIYDAKMHVRKDGYAFFSHLPEYAAELATDFSWVDKAVLAYRATLMRFQHLDSVMVIAANHAELSERLEAREFLYFFEEGLPQFTLERLMGLPRIPDIHLKLVDYFALEKVSVKNVVSNTHTGFTGWFWIAPHLWAVYLAYTLFLAWAGIWLARKAGGPGLLMEVVWFAWLGWILNGWFAAYIDFLQALIILMIVRLLSARDKKDAAVRCAEASPGAAA